MKIIINKDMKISDNTAVALGNFDGIHIGHKALIKSTIDKGKQKGLIPSVFTFNDHTSKLLNKNLTGFLLSKSRKEEILKQIGVKLLYKIDFNEIIRHLCPEDFVKEILVNKINAKLVVVGFNYRFGYKGMGNAETLKKLGKKYNFDVDVIEPVVIDGDVVSSSLIRQLITKGHIEKANKMLGRNFTVEGSVIQGKSIGKTLGFPTANLELDCNYVIPKFGVYKTSTYYMGIKHRSITNVGYNPTFKSNNVNIETHILNYEGDLYNKQIKIFFENFIREEMKFKDKDSLVYQIKKDISSIYNL